MEAAANPWPALGVLLLRDGLVDQDELEELLGEQRDTRQHRLSGWKLGEILVDRGRVTAEQVARLVAEQYELPYLELDVDTIDLRIAGRLSEDLVDRFTALPVELLDGGSVLVAVSDPGIVLFTDELRRSLGMPVRFAVVAPAAIKAAITFAREHARHHPPVDSAWPTGTSSFDLVRAGGQGGDATAPGRPALTFAPPPTTETWPPLGTLLVRDGLVTEDELEAALAQQRLSSNKRLGEILVERGSLTRSDVARVVAEQYELPYVDVADDELDDGIANLLPLELSTRYSAIPLRFQPDDSLLVAVADPTTVMDAGELFSELGGRLDFAVADPDVIEAALLRRRLHPLRATSGAETEAVGHEPPTDAEPGETPEAEGEVVADPTLSPSEQDGAHERDQDGRDDEPVGPSDDPAAEAAADVPLADDHPADDPAPDADPTGAVDVHEDTGEEPAVGDMVASPDVQVASDASAASLADEPVELEDEVLGELVQLSVQRPDLPWSPDDLLDENDEAARLDRSDARPEPSESELAAAIQELLDRACELGATSVAFAPRDGELAALARIDGELRELDVMADIDRGMLGRALAADHATEVITLPTRRGELHTARFALDPAPVPALPDLGLEATEEQVLRSALGQRSGIVVLAGADRETLTSSISSVLHELAARGGLVLTVGHPLDEPLEGVHELTRSGALGRALLAEPDTIVAGEDVDGRTADLLVRAARDTLVVAAVRAGTPSDALRLLLGLGVDPSALASTLACALARSRVRRTCLACREAYYASREELVALGRPEDEVGRRLLGRGRGCDACGHTGYDGAGPLVALLPADEELRRRVADGTPLSDATAFVAGSDAARDELARLCLDGVTTFAEVRRVLGPAAPPASA